MAILIVAIIVLGYLLIGTSYWSGINKSAVAVFMCAVGWVLYICWGADFVSAQHGLDYADFLGDARATSSVVKDYISQHVFLKYVGRTSETVLFLLATLTIVEILSMNGCFDFVRYLMKSRRSATMLWWLSVVTFLISANLDNLTTTLMMLGIMHSVISSRRDRMVFGSAIVISANCGGALTVIGDPTGLVLWNMEAVTATDYSLTLLVPCLIAWSLPIYLLSRMLPERIECSFSMMPYRGDDARLSAWERMIFLIVGIGGLWFIPTFHNITHLSPFLGAICVLGVLWIVNEFINRRFFHTDHRSRNTLPDVLKYGSVQMILFVLGVMLSLGVLTEIGAMKFLSEQFENYVSNVWLEGVIAGSLSTILDNFASAMAAISIGEEAAIAQGDIFWKVIAYATAVGGNVLAVGSMSGVALLISERMHIGWFFRNVGWKALLSSLLGLIAMWAIYTLTI